MKRRAGKTHVAVGTTSGAFLLTSDGERRRWRRAGPFLKGESVNSFRYREADSSLFAASLGEGVFVSDDLGRSWAQKNRGLHVRKVWAVEVDPKESRTLYAGTHYGLLFRSDDNGRKWEEVVGLHTAPRRSEWGIDWAFGTTGLALHNVGVDPNNSDRIYVVSSGGGTYRSDDRGGTWALLQKGMLDSCPVGGGQGAPDIPQSERAAQLEQHLKRVHTCTHRLALSASGGGRIYQQSHCGVFQSTNSGDSWQDISPGDETRHGFPLVLLENGTSALYTIPAFQGGCKKHNSCIQGQLAVYRRLGSDWQKVTKGLPKSVHTCVLRDGMASDGLAEPGIYFGTTTGEVYCSLDSGDSWSQLMRGAGRIQGIASFAT